MFTHRRSWARCCPFDCGYWRLNLGRKIKTYFLIINSALSFITYNKDHGSLDAGTRNLHDEGTDFPLSKKRNCFPGEWGNTGKCWHYPGSRQDGLQNPAMWRDGDRHNLSRLHSPGSSETLVVITMQPLEDLILWDPASTPRCPAPGDRTVGRPLQPLLGPGETRQPLLCATWSMGSAPHPPPLTQQHSPSTQYHGVGWGGAGWGPAPKPASKGHSQASVEPGCTSRGSGPTTKPASKESCRTQKQSLGKTLAKVLLAKRQCRKTGRGVVPEGQRGSSLPEEMESDSRVKCLTAAEIKTHCHPAKREASSCLQMDDKETDTKFPSLQSIATTLPLNKSRF